MEIQLVAFALLAVVAGALVPIQTGYNIQLVRAFDSPFVASSVVFLSGTLGLFAISLFSGAHWPSRAEIASAPLLSWVAGGVLAAVYVVSLIFAAPRLGAGTLVVFVVFGQILCSMTIDHFGLLSFPVHQMNWPRMIGIAAMVAGVTLIKLF